MEKVIQRRANNGKEKHQNKENKYTIVGISIIAGIIAYYICKWLDSKL